MGNLLPRNKTVALAKALLALPQDIFHGEIIPRVARDWLFVSKKFNAIASRAILSDRRVDPSRGDNKAIKWAAASGDDVLMATLLADPRVDPAADNDTPIRIASFYGHVKVVALLLKDKRVNPAAHGGLTIPYTGTTKLAVMSCYERRYLRYFTSMLSEYPIIMDNTAIRWAARNGHDHVVVLLLTDTRVNPAAANNYAIGFAARTGHARVVGLLLTDTRVNPAAANNYAIVWAHNYGFKEIVDKLRADPRVATSLSPRMMLMLIK